MKLDDVYEGMGHTVRKGFSVKKVFGEPIKINDEVTIIPVAKIKMSGGGGGGGEEGVSGAEIEGEAGEESAMKSQGGGFGFGGGVKPVGYIKIKGSCVKFVRIHDWEKIAFVCVPLTILAIKILKHKMMEEKCWQGGHVGHAGWEHKKKMMMMHHKGGMCPICGMHHMGPCQGHGMHHKAMMHHHCKPCHKCGMHHMGPCPGHGMHEMTPEIWKHKKKKWMEAKEAGSRDA